MSKINFSARWKEELVAFSHEGTLVFELTMGKLHIYFPDHRRWLNAVPEWAKEKWQFYLDSCTDWCNENKIPMTITGDAYVYEEENS